MLNLLADLKEEFGLTYLFISHDLAVVEVGSARDIFANPRHPYTALMAQSAPEVGRPIAAPETAETELPDPLSPPAGCAFNERCPFATDQCRRERPTLKANANGRDVACFNPLEGNAKSP